MSNKKDDTVERVAQLEKELADQKAKVEALERANKPKEPFKPEPFQRYDPTAGMTMPPSALAAMVNAEPRGFMRGVVADNRGPTGPSSGVPSSQSTGGSGPTNVPGSGTGWAREIPLGPSMHARYVDAQIDVQDAKDRQERIQQAVSAETARRLAEQGEKLQKLADQLAEQDKK
jgi:hypothetical protein